MNGPSPDRPTHRFAVAADALVCLRFYTRLPIPALPFEPPVGREPFSVVLRLAPVAGLVVGLVSAAVLCGATALNLPSLVAVGLSLLATVLVTGGLHEDGLADCADGFGGGSTRARKLEIMRDSRPRRLWRSGDRLLASAPRGSAFGLARSRRNGKCLRGCDRRRGGIPRLRTAAPGGAWPGPPRWRVSCGGAACRDGLS